MSTDETNAARRGSESNDQLGLLSERVAAAGCPPPGWVGPGVVPSPVGRLYTQAELEAAVATERAESARLRHLLNLARDDYNTAAQRLQDIGDYAHDHSTGPAWPDALWEVRSMAYGSGA